MDLKHVGRIKNNGKKCLVVFRTLPGDSSYCLIIPTEVLSDSQHDALINCVEGNTAQSSFEFGEVLARVTFPDGRVMLSALHADGKLVRIATKDIEMMPNTTTSVQLSELNQMIAEQRGTTVDELAIKSPVKSENPKSETVDVATIKELPEVKEQEFVENTDTSPEETAKRYRSQADKLSKEAANLRRMAEDLVPTKKPERKKVES
jgi:hypothetical protein